MLYLFTGLCSLPEDWSPLSQSPSWHRLAASRKVHRNSVYVFTCVYKYACSNAMYACTFGYMYMYE